MSVVTDPKTEARVLGRKLAIDGWETKLYVRFVVTSATTCYDCDLANRECRVANGVMLVESNPISWLGSCLASVPVEFNLTLLNVPTRRTLGQRREGQEDPNFLGRVQRSCPAIV